MVANCLRVLRRVLIGILALGAASLCLTACSGEGDSLSRDEVRQIVREEIEQQPGAVGDQLSMADVERVVAEAIDDATGQMTPPATSEESGGMAPGDGVSSKSLPAAYTQHVVAGAVDRYETDGFDATVAHYSDIDSVDGQWYVFIIDASGEVVAHYDADRIGLNVASWVGTDVNGYSFGPELLSATEDGKWVTYVYRNPATGNLSAGDFGESQLKNVWVVRRGDLLFASGWHIDIDEFIQTEVASAIEAIESGTALDPSQPGSLTAGLQSTISYYNSTDAFDGTMIAFLADNSGLVLESFHNPGLVGSNIVDVLGTAALNGTATGTWITHDDNPLGEGPGSMRVWVVNRGGIILGGGIYSSNTG